MRLDVGVADRRMGSGCESVRDGQDDVAVGLAALEGAVAVREADSSGERVTMRPVPRSSARTATIVSDTS